MHMPFDSACGPMSLIDESTHPDLIFLRSSGDSWQGPSLEEYESVEMHLGEEADASWAGSRCTLVRKQKRQSALSCILWPVNLIKAPIRRSILHDRHS